MDGPSRTCSIAMFWLGCYTFWNYWDTEWLGKFWEVWEGPWNSFYCNQKREWNSLLLPTFPLVEFRGGGRVSSRWLLEKYDLSGVGFCTVPINTNVVIEQNGKGPEIFQISCCPQLLVPFTANSITAPSKMFSNTSLSDMLNCGSCQLHCH